MEKRKKDAPREDPVREAGEESFPASDPPSYSGTTAGNPPSHAPTKEKDKSRPRDGDERERPGTKSGP